MFGDTATLIKIFDKTIRKKLEPVFLDIERMEGRRGRKKEGRRDLYPLILRGPQEQLSLFPILAKKPLIRNNH